MLTTKQAAALLAHKHTEKRAAGVLGAIGSGLDTAAKGLGKGWWRAMAGAKVPRIPGKPAWSEKAHPLLTLLGTGLTGSAATEAGAAAIGHPHWAPENQYYRDRTAGGLLGHLKNLATRPIQTTFGSRVPSSPEQWMERAAKGGKLPGLRARYEGYDPATGQPRMSYSGGGNIMSEPALLQAMREHEQQKRLLGETRDAQQPAARHSYQSNFSPLRPSELL